MAEMCLHPRWMPVQLALCIAVSIVKDKGNITNCCCHRAVKLLEHGEMLVEMVLEKRFCRIVTFYKMQSGFMPKRGMNDAVFILKKCKKCIMLK